MKDYIMSLTDQFLEEARKAPYLLADMAKMEKYMAESYSERSFSELIQNADDANASAFHVGFYHGNLYVANNGRPFSKQDILSICRSGASTKDRGKSIGYRGVGFKSTTCFSDRIIISSDSCSFSFSREVLSQQLCTKCSMVPIVRVPFWEDANSIPIEIQRDIQRLQKEGYSTVFVFRDADLSICKKDISTLTIECMLFLRNITSISSDITIGGINYYRREVTEKNSHRCIELTNSLSGTTTTWELIGNRGVFYAAIPTYMNEEYERSPSLSNMVFHCFLPTMDSTGIGMRINGDFSTDPSRKHLVNDAKTEKELLAIANLIGQEIRHAYTLKNEIAAVGIVKGVIGFYTNNVFSGKLYNGIIEALNEEEWLTTIHGTPIGIDKAIILPAWVDPSCVEAIKYAIPVSTAGALVYIVNQSYRSMLVKITQATFDALVLLPLISIPAAMSMLSSENSIRFIAAICQAARISNINAEQVLDSALVSIDGRVYLLSTAFDDKKYCKSFSRLVAGYSDEATAQWIFAYFGINVHESSPTASLLARKKRIIPNWQTAEQVCLEFELQKGNVAEDVSRKNLGYDIISTEQNGRIRFIEVKSVQRMGESVVLTNNEYSTAHSYGSQYEICVVELGNNPKVKYISDPVNSCLLEKRARAWEWVLSDYSL